MFIILLFYYTIIVAIYVAIIRVYLYNVFLILVRVEGIYIYRATLLYSY
jgi:hypothetical protein